MVWLLLAAAFCGADLAIKKYIQSHKSEGEHQPVFGGKIIITRFYNEGAMMGFLKDKTKLLFGITCVIFGMVLGILLFLIGKPENRLLKFGLSLLLGGAASNAYERCFKGKVTDYFSLNIGIKPLKRVVFNIGDFFIFIGSIIAVISEVKK